METLHLQARNLNIRVSPLIRSTLSTSPFPPNNLFLPSNWEYLCHWRISAHPLAKLHRDHLGLNERVRPIKSGDVFRRAPALRTKRSSLHIIRGNLFRRGVRLFQTPRGRDGRRDCLISLKPFGRRRKSGEKEGRRSR